MRDEQRRHERPCVRGVSRNMSDRTVPERDVRRHQQPLLCGVPAVMRGRPVSDRHMQHVHDIATAVLGVHGVRGRDIRDDTMRTAGGRIVQEPRVCAVCDRKQLHGNTVSERDMHGHDDTDMQAMHDGTELHTAAVFERDMQRVEQPDVCWVRLHMQHVQRECGDAVHIVSSRTRVHTQHRWFAARHMHNQLPIEVLCDCSRRLCAV